MGVISFQTQKEALALIVVECVGLIVLPIFR